VHAPLHRDLHGSTRRGITSNTWRPRARPTASEPRVRSGKRRRRTHEGESNGREEAQASLTFMAPGVGAGGRKPASSGWSAGTSSRGGARRLRRRTSSAVGSTSAPSGRREWRRGAGALQRREPRLPTASRLLRRGA
jgi:hypothetical protein